MSRPLYQRIYDFVRQVPTGSVTTYGQLSRLVGCTARTVGFAMAALANDTDVPWHRVINSQGKISKRADGDRDFLQQELLVAEGVTFSCTGTVDLQKYAWEFTPLNSVEN